MRSHFPRLRRPFGLGATLLLLLVGAAAAAGSASSPTGGSPAASTAGTASTLASTASTAVPTVPTATATDVSPTKAGGGARSAPGRAAEAGFEDTTQVVSVQVPVEVVGRDGQPVRGLTADDFEVFDEGRRQPLRSFRTIDLDLLEPAGTQTSALPPDVQQLEASARRHFLLLFDLSFARPSAVLRAREAARDFVLHSLRPTDLAAVATYSLQTGPRLIVTFTMDRAQLARGIQSLGLDNVVDQGKGDPLRFVIAPPTGADLAAGGTPIDLQQTRSSVTEQAMAQNLATLRNAVTSANRSYDRSMIRSYLQAMGGLAKILDAVKGRKHVVLFSEGFDSNLLLGHDTVSDEAQVDNFNVAFGDLWMVDNDNRFGSTQLQNELRKMLHEFKRADCVIEAVDISGLVTTNGDVAEQSRSTRTSGTEELFETANETGGELFTYTNDFRHQLDRVLNRSTVTYLLSFERSDLPADGAFHRLRVTVKAPSGARIAYREGYYAPRPYPQLDPLAKTLLASEGVASAAPRADLDLNVLVTPFRGHAKAYVPVIVEVGGPRLLAGRKGDKLAIELYAYVSDSHGQMQDFFTQKVAVDLAKTSKDVLAAGLKYYGHVDLAPGQYLVRVLVRDATTGRTGVETLPVTIPAWDRGAPLLLQPLFVDSRTGWLMVREHAAQESKQKSVVYPFMLGTEPYVPAALPAVPGDGKAKVCLVGYNLGPGDLSLQAKVMAADGVPRDGGNLQLVSRVAGGASGPDELVATFQPTGLGAGRYTLQVAVFNPRTGRREVSSGPFQVVP